MKPAIDIERLLQWAYRDELPKQTIGELRPSWEPITDYGDRGGVGFDDGRDPDAPRYPVALGAPDPDALQVEYVVRSLETYTPIWEQSHALTWGLGELLAHYGDLRAYPFQLDQLVASHARMGSRPVWDLGPLTPARKIGRNGKPIIAYEDNGQILYGWKGTNLGPKSRCLLEWMPAPADVVYARAEYAAWRAGVVEVLRRLQGWSLTRWTPTPPVASAAPWIRNTEYKPRILRDLSGPIHKPPERPRKDLHKVGT